MSYLSNTRSLHICSKRVSAITLVWYRIPIVKLPVAYLLSFTKKSIVLQNPEKVVATLPPIHYLLTVPQFDSPGPPSQQSWCFGFSPRQFSWGLWVLFSTLHALGTSLAPAEMQSVLAGLALLCGGSRVPFHSHISRHGRYKEKKLSSATKKFFPTGWDS